MNWMLAAILICGTSVVTTSCGGDDSDSPSDPQDSKFTVNASVVLDKNLAEYGYLEATYSYKDKTGTIQLKKGDISDQFPTANNFGNTVIQNLKQQFSVDYSSNDFIIRNVVIKDLDKSKYENAVFKIRFVVDPQHPEYTEKSDFVAPNVLGYTEGGLKMVKSSLYCSKGVHPDGFEDWLARHAQEVTITFGLGAASE